MSKYDVYSPHCIDIFIILWLKILISEFYVFYLPNRDLDHLFNWEYLLGWMIEKTRLLS